MRRAHADSGDKPVMFSGVHVLLHSGNPEADRALFGDVLAIPAIDSGEGYVIFALPPAEMGIHPADAPQPTAQAGPATRHRDGLPDVP